MITKSTLIFICILFSITQALSEEDRYVHFEQANLVQGRIIWIDSCEGCHAYGIAESPNPLKAKDWQNRVVKPIDVLYDHAINGFFGPEDTMMPPRGGNDSLSDDEVKLAVDYMKALAEYYINKEDN